MRDRPVPCKNATLREFVAGRHRTFNDSAVCNRCAALRSGLAREGGRVPTRPAPTSLTRQERAARNEATAAAVERLIAATVPGAGASRPALHQPSAPGAPRVLP